MGLNKLVVRATSAHTATVIFIHGLGDSGAGWQPVAQILSRTLPHVKFVLPHAPEQPVTLNGGFRMPSWYDIRSLDKIASNEDEDGMNVSMRKINELIREEIDSGIPANRIVLGGFSQGGAMTLFTGLQSEMRLAGLAVLSGYMPVRERLIARATDASKQVPIFHGHGTADEVVLYQYGEMTSNLLQQKGYNVDFHSYNHMGHATCNEELPSNRLQFLQAKQQSLSAKARRDIALLLENGKLASAEIRVESIIRDDLHIEAMEIVELFCELLHARAAIIDQSTELDKGLCEAVHSVIYASSRIQAKELPHIRDILGIKFGKELVKNALVNADELVNAKLLKKLSLDPPAPKLVRLYLKEIAAAYSVDWMPQNGDDDGGGSPSFGFKEPANVATPPEASPAINSDANEADAAKSKDAADQEESSDAGIDQLSPPPTHKALARSTSPVAAKPVPVAATSTPASIKAASSNPQAEPPGKGVPTLEELRRRFDALGEL
ncbi:hypothetical protein LPJ68_003825 [Coemansia sp. RSA 1086]|nr:hypothetical protein LPJ68_003825 [Coemansia sp. RSA 1086]